MLPAFYPQASQPAMPLWNWKEWCFNALYSNLFILSAPRSVGSFCLWYSSSPVLCVSRFPYWATFNLPSGGLQLNVKHPEKSKQKTASLDLNISRDPWPPPSQVPDHYLCFKSGMWNIRKSWILVLCIFENIYDYLFGKNLLWWKAICKAKQAEKVLTTKNPWTLEFDLKDCFCFIILVKYFSQLLAVI